MIKHNLKEIVNFTKSNNDFSDFNILNNFKLNLNKYKSINSYKQFGGNINNLQQPLNSNIQYQQPNFQYQQQLDPNFQYQPQLDPNLQNQQQLDPNRGLINNQIVQQDMFLGKPQFVTDSIQTYTIPAGTILYYSSTEKRGFNTNSIQLYGPNSLNNSSESISLFTPNFRLASDKIQGCSIDKQKGYIHVFRVIREIPDIFIKLPYDTNDDITLNDLHKDFCEGTNRYSGVGFFYSKNEIELFNNNVINNSNTTSTLEINTENYYSEFYLCNPRPYVEYMYSQKCMSLRKLSNPYKFA